LAENDRKHQKRLKEAQKTWDRYTGLYKAEKITSDELKDKLRPFKDELIELGLIKGDRKEEAPPAQPGPEVPMREPVRRAVPIPSEPWTRRSNLTVDEIRERIDMLGSAGPSESLRETYRSKYGEDLPTPPEDVTFQVSSRASGVHAPDPGEVMETGEPESNDISEKSKGFLKSLFNRNKGA